MPLSEDLDRLDTAMRQLQTKWDTFFSGAEKKPPLELQGQVEALVKRYANAEIRNGGERFRYQSLSTRFATFNELWQKRLRAREEGRVFGQHGLRAEALPPRPQTATRAAPAAAAAAPDEQRSGEFRVQDAGRDQTVIRGLYERFVQARQTTGAGPAPSFDSFQKLVSQQADRILREKGASAVDFRLETKDGKVALKARVVR